MNALLLLLLIFFIVLWIFKKVSSSGLFILFMISLGFGTFVVSVDFIPDLKMGYLTLEWFLWNLCLIVFYFIFFFSFSFLKELE